MTESSHPPIVNGRLLMRLAIHRVKDAEDELHIEWLLDRDPEEGATEKEQRAIHASLVLLAQQIEGYLGSPPTTPLEHAPHRSHRVDTSVSPPGYA